jgi:glucuronate isomerase
MKKFMGDDFLLETPSAVKLYSDYASKLPIIDYHCHLSPREIAENKKFSNITELWLYADHYKWRAMRSCGVDEKYITGNGSDFEKFREYCRIMPLLIGNPVYHWSHLELRRYFDCDLTINSENCEKIWQLTADKLARDNYGAQDYIRNSGVVLLCTTDDPADDLRYHRQIKESGFEVKVLPAFRPDKGFNIERRGIVDYIKALGNSTGVDINDYDSLCQAYTVALDRFDELGCKTADHGMDNYISFVKPDKYHADEIFKKALASDGADITENELALWKTQLMRFFGLEYVKRNWVLQLHYGVLRNANKTMFAKLGADAGYDMIHAKSCVADIAYVLDYMQTNDALPKTIIYPINPTDNAAVGTLCGCFCRGDGSNTPTVVQGSGWWFNDNIDGMEAQMKSFANLASLGNFLGMLTDSRSFMSYPRHEYFRRILCNIIGGWVDKGLYPDFDAAADIVKRISYENTRNYFGFDI